MGHSRLLLLFSALHCSISAVTVIPLTLNIPKPYESDAAPVTSDSDLLSKLHTGSNLSTEPMFSTYTWEHNNKIPLNGTYASQDSFVRGAIDASAKHQHLVIQPQDVWLTVLKQLSFYLRKHKDDKEVAENWDNREGKATPSHSGLFLRDLARYTRDQFNLRSKADWMLEWARPGFTTISQHPYYMIQNSTEELMANALLMSSPYPSTEDMPAFPCKNGFPSITLNGTQSDWKAILEKISSLEKFGKEPKLYGRLLHAVVSRFVQTFDNPNDPATRLFWNNMITITARQNLCSSTELITGWINAFHMWTPAGNLAITAAVTTASEAVQLDGITFPWRHAKDTPIANSHVPMCVDGDSPISASSPILVGMLAKSVKQGKPEGYEAAMKLAGFTLPSTVAESDHSILQPLPIWIAHYNATGNCCTPDMERTGRC
ncbi:hypothetical protein EJ08DRAFT_716097 [Tothia fuscella]|uniref:Uncharacterized protein n=1 Tax=Tothia fuscella TaxID=1048955 RepID=A0A9P4TYJ5_9PEZI|nr:hypothetical protein EJ08DRAFT_716097 [Tothia fuscella]